MISPPSCASSHLTPGPGRRSTTIASPTVSHDGAASWRASSAVPSPASSRHCESQCAGCRRRRLHHRQSHRWLRPPHPQHHAHHGRGRRYGQWLAVVAFRSRQRSSSRPRRANSRAGGPSIRGTLTVAEHRNVHARLVHDYGADPRATGIARVYRVPGFWHLKGEPFLVRVVGGDNAARRQGHTDGGISTEPASRPRETRPRNTPLSGVDVGKTGLDRLTAPLKAILADDYGSWIGSALHCTPRAVAAATVLPYGTRGQPAPQNIVLASAPSAGPLSSRRSAA